MLRSVTVRSLLRRTSLFAIASAAALAPRPVDAQVFQPGTQPSGTDGGLLVAIQPSRGCRTCHGGYDGEDDHSPYESWRGSLMASAGRDPVANAAIAIAERDHPDAADFCLRCHSPTAWLAGRSHLPEYDPANPLRPERLAPDGPGGLSPERDGIGCMVCHRMLDPRLQPPPLSDAAIANAQLVIADGEDGNARRGPYAYAPGEEPMHATAVEPFLSSAEPCGSCHDIHNPLLHGFRGSEPTGRPFAIERTYSEWRHSAFADRGQTCQTCHMPEVEAYAADEAQGGVLRSAMNRHDLAGANVWVPRAIAEAVRAFDPAAAGWLEASSVRARRMLENAATLEVRAAALEGARASATVRVTNETGHKLPTGYPEGRRMWLEVAVVDARGRVIASSGLYDSETDDLQRDPQLRTYEAKLGQRGIESFHFVLNDTLLEDTRIPPEGFRAPPEADIAPLGRDYGDGAGGYRHFDEASYVFDGLCGDGALSLRVRLLYQSSTRQYMEFLRDEAPPSADPALGGRSWGQLAYEAWRAHGGDEPVEMESVTVPLGLAPDACPGPDAGLDAAWNADAAGAEDAGLGPPETGMDAGGGPASSGCGCRVGGRPAHGVPFAWPLLLGLAGWAARFVVRRLVARQRRASLMRCTKRRKR